MARCPHAGKIGETERTRGIVEFRYARRKSAHTCVRDNQTVTSIALKTRRFGINSADGRSIANYYRTACNESGQNWRAHVRLLSWRWPGSCWQLVPTLAPLSPFPHRLNERFRNFAAHTRARICIPTIASENTEYVRCTYSHHKYWFNCNCSAIAIKADKFYFPRRPLRSLFSLRCTRTVLAFISFRFFPFPRVVLALKCSEHSKSLAMGHVRGCCTQCSRRHTLD